MNVCPVARDGFAVDSLVFGGEDVSVVLLGSVDKLADFVEATVCKIENVEAKALYFAVPLRYPVFKKDGANGFVF